MYRRVCIGSIKCYDILFKELGRLWSLVSMGVLVGIQYEVSARCYTVFSVRVWL
jgi:hypothetical protein